MKASSWVLLSGLVCASIATTVPAYELATHSAITYEASKRSVLNDSQFLKDLGIDIQTKPDEPLGAVYFDVSGAAALPRESNTFEDAIIKRLGVQPLSIQGWLLRGAIREDDYIGTDAPNPQDDPYNTGSKLKDTRSLSHFFDPARNRSLTTILGVALGKKAPDWASGAADVFTQPNTPDAARRNHFTVFDAREAMYRALTGRKQGGSDIEKKDDQAERHKYWATTFRALGDIVHLVEDMAQPQHTQYPSRRIA